MEKEVIITVETASISVKTASILTGIEANSGEIKTRTDEIVAISPDNVTLLTDIGVISSDIVFGLTEMEASSTEIGVKSSVIVFGLTDIRAIFSDIFSLKANFWNVLRIKTPIPL